MCQLSCRGCPVLVVKSLMSRSSRPVLCVWSRLTCRGWPVMPNCLSWTVQAVLSSLSCPGCSVSAVLGRGAGLSSPGCPVPVVLSGCPVELYFLCYHVLAILSFLPSCPFPAVLSWLSFQDRLPRLSCPSLPVLSSFGHLVISFLSWLPSHYCYQYCPFQLSCLSTLLPSSNGVLSFCHVLTVPS
jgi:hypothetical protein